MSSRKSYTQQKKHGKKLDKLEELLSFGPDELIKHIYKRESDKLMKPRFAIKKSFQNQISDEVETIERKLLKTYYQKKKIVKNSQLNVVNMSDSEKICEFARRDNAFYTYKNNSRMEEYISNLQKKSLSISLNESNRLPTISPQRMHKRHKNLEKFKDSYKLSKTNSPIKETIFRTAGSLNNKKSIRNRLGFFSNRMKELKSNSNRLDNLIKDCLEEENRMGQSLYKASIIMNATSRQANNCKKISKKIDKLSQVLPNALGYLYYLKSNEQETIENDVKEDIKKVNLMGIGIHSLRTKRKKNNQ